MESLFNAIFKNVFCYEIKVVIYKKFAKNNSDFNMSAAKNAAQQQMAAAKTVPAN